MDIRIISYKPNEDPKLYTRGDGNYGQDISYLIKLLLYPDLKIMIQLR